MRETLKLMEEVLDGLHKNTSYDQRALVKAERLKDIGMMIHNVKLLIKLLDQNEFTMDHLCVFYKIRDDILKMCFSRDAVIPVYANE